ncbi:hypothetical protein Fcan01_16818, partial [Folsomia candida]
MLRHKLTNDFPTGLLTFIFTLICLFNIDAESSFVEHVISPGKIEISDYLTPFEGCTNIIFIPKNPIDLKLDKAPIILLKTTIQEEQIDKRFSLERRRNVIQHCWASFGILPNPNNLSKYMNWRHRYIKKTSFGIQYFVIVTNFKSTFQKFIETLGAASHRYILREIIIVEVVLDTERIILPVLENNDKDGIVLYYHNMYHHDGIILKGQKSKWWYKITCSIPAGQNCFKKLQAIGDTVSNLNKYFWNRRTNTERMYNRLDSNANPIKRWYSVSEKFIPSNLISLVEFWLLNEHIEYVKLNITPFYNLPVLKKYASAHIRPLEFIMQKVQTASFLSCYNVKQESFILSALNSPFDVESWILIQLGIWVMIISLTLLPRVLSSDGVMVVVGILLENSVLNQSEKFTTRFPKRSSKYGIHLLIAAWVLLAGTTLTNWYKALFTMELVTPPTYAPPWETTLDIEGIQVLMPYNLLDMTGMETAIDRYMRFYISISEIFFPYNYETKKYQEMKTSHNGFKRMASHIEKTIPLLNVRMSTQDNGSIDAFYKRLELISYNEVLPVSPYKPIHYKEVERFVNTLSTCEKTAFIDTKENIASLLPFVNDNADKRKYFAGKEPFFTVVRGWDIFPIRANYVQKRLKVMIHSGIYGHWEAWFRFAKPNKLFHHYANWTYPKFDAVSQLNYNSKILSGFYIS